MKLLLKGFVCSENFTTVNRRAVLIDGERIAAVENDICGSCAADKIIKFKDEIIAPGFIDAHGHSDISALAAPECFTKISQGITTEICGNCGLSAFPLTDDNYDHLTELYSNYQIKINWHDYNSYQTEISRISPEMQLFSLTGHNSLRAAVAGYETRELSGAQIEIMRNLLAAQFKAGSPGLSSGLLYVPGIFATPDELLALMKTAAAYNKVYTTHLRSEGEKLLESLEETLQLAQRANLKKVLISHLKTAGNSNFHKLSSVLELIRHYRATGMDVRFDRYPYIESQTMLSVALGEKYSHYGDRELMSLLKNSEERAAAVAHLHNIRDEKYWQTRRLAGTTHPEYRKFQGEFFAAIPADPTQCVVEILSRYAETSMIAAANMSEENMLQIISAPEALFGSDGNALPPDERFGRPHPRSSGSAAKFARLLLDRNVPLGEVCWKLAGAAADFFNLKDRGTIASGKYADITVFSPEDINSDADFRDPFKTATGIRFLSSCGRPHYF